ncbi:hypothetical protein COJE103337_03825 [Corynebacterium jeikeium]|uniref:hypothetical protein n=1 Tax=Corynebacterium jeikeium TaxID=38289 RepID=UPI0001B71B7A|nr:hypothetical protein [Corynebacterium jeikeium]EEW17376.1 hypothetical protein HMPREF0297_0253 [Corynebacterium jeikeium ATCC 43734]OOD30763.1 hypothetical protein BWP03_06815 [Corynebacterium jeikeium]WCZ54123.1 hypothetical protein CJEIK_08140 [Corynebacterium jeikeium]SUY80571.1 Uncharacterised protein [Corynebacterium jeikeium]
MTPQKLSPMAWVRLIIYILAALVGIAAVVATTLGYGDIAALLGTLAGAGAAITGGTAAANLPKAPDQAPLAGLDLVAALQALPTIAAAAQTYQQQASYEPRHAAPEVEPEIEGAYPGLDS